MFLAKVSPAQSLLPAPKGSEKSFFKSSWPFLFKNLSGLKFSGSTQTSFELCNEKSPASTIVSLGIVNPANVVSFIARCGTDEGTRVSNLIISLSAASVYGMLEGNHRSDTIQQLRIAISLDSVIQFRKSPAADHSIKFVMNQLQNVRTREEISEQEGNCRFDS